jgi:2-polyprenyl-6-methoxyphenol hydroxylase-like FAD-dependent oxidoreductase
MSTDSTSNLDAQQPGNLAGFELPPDFSMPALAEIEQILALGDRSWTSLLGIDLPLPELVPVGRHAIVIGGSMAGLLAARVLAEFFDRVTIVDRDRLPAQPAFRDGVPQSRHLHALLRRGLDVIEDLFPGFESDLVAAGGVPLKGSDFLRMSAAGWASRFDGPPLVAATRELIEWSVRTRVAQLPKVVFLDQQEVTGLVVTPDGSTAAGVTLRRRGGPAQVQLSELRADLVVDASGRNSKAPDWLESLGFPRPDETVIDSFLGYASRLYSPTPDFQADWKVLMIGDKPPHMPRAGVLSPIDGNRWMVTLAGYGRDYPPTDEAGFLEFAATLRSDILYRTIKDAQPISGIRGFRGTRNQRRHFESLARRPERFVVIGDAACAFNPVYGQGMSATANTALALMETLSEHAGAASLDDLTGLAARVQRKVAAASQAAWIIATGADVRYPTTEGRQPAFADRVMHAYLDRVIEVSMHDAKVNEAFLQVVHLLDEPKALFKPAVVFRTLTGSRTPIAEAPTKQFPATLRAARA